MMADKSMSPRAMQSLWEERKQQYSGRDKTGRRVREILANRLDAHFKDLVRPGEEPVVANMVWAAARIIAQRSGRMPRIECEHRFDSDRSRNRAADHQRQLKLDAERMGLGKTIMQAAYWLVVHDMAPFILRPSAELEMPVVEVKDPLACYPGTVWPHRPELYDCLFATEMSTSAAAAVYKGVAEYRNQMDRAKYGAPSKVTIGEYYDGNGKTTALLMPGRTEILDFEPALVPGRCFVFIGRGFSPDLDFHGQFDHAIPTLIAQAKLYSLVMAYTEQQVFAETTVVGEIVSNGGRYAYGPGAVNQLTPQPGASVQKLNNQMSPQIFQILNDLERQFRISGGFPAQMSGEPVATVATGKGLEQLTLAADDNVLYYQDVLQEALTKVMRSYPSLAQAMGSDGSENYWPGDVRTYVKFLSGADPSETVRMLQLRGDKELARETVMARLPEVEDPATEMRRVDVEEMREALKAGVAAQLQNMTMAPTEVAHLMQKMKKGDHLEDVLVEMQSQQAAAQSQQAPQGPQGLAGLLGLGGQSEGQTIADTFRQQNLASRATRQQFAPPAQIGGGQ